MQWAQCLFECRRFHRRWPPDDDTPLVRNDHPIIVLFRVDGKFSADHGADSNHERDSDKICWALSALSDITDIFPQIGWQ
jgi:hypothetical protein